MSYNFKKLAEVEEIQEVTPTTKAFVEVDGEVMRAPYSSGGTGEVNINELSFELDVSVEVPEETNYQSRYNSFVLTNMNQVKNILDNKMSIHFVYNMSGCCSPTGDRYEYIYNTHNWTNHITSNVIDIPYTSGSYGDTSNLKITFDGSSEDMTPLSARFYMSKSYTVDSIYATI